MNNGTHKKMSKKDIGYNHYNYKRLKELKVLTQIVQNPSHFIYLFYFKHSSFSHKVIFLKDFVQQGVIFWLQTVSNVC